MAEVCEDLVTYSNQIVRIGFRLNPIVLNRINVILNKGKSIQKEIQVKLSKLLKEKVVLIGSGRTDTGVHAIEQSAHFDCKKEIQNLDKLLKSINHFINDKGISILAIKKRSLKFKFLAQEHSQKKRLFFC